MIPRPSVLGFADGLTSWRQILPYALLLSVTVALYGSSLYFDFVWDDVAYVEKNFRVQGLSLMHFRAFWTGAYLAHYAPMHHTLLAILYHFSALEPFGYHLGQVLLHAACLGVLYFLLKKMGSARIAFLASLLFAVYPPNTETVAWISETKSTLAFLFFLLSFWFFVRLRADGGWRDGLLCALFLVLSMLAKINTVVAPAVFLLYDYQQGYRFTKSRLASLAGYFLLSAAMTGVHLRVSYEGSQQVLEGAYFGGLGVHLLNLPLLVLFYARMVVVPYPLSAWHMFPVHQQMDAVAGAAWIALLGLAWLVYRSNRNIQFWSLWFLVFLLPVLQIVPFPIWVADRYLYIPAIGPFVLASQGFFWIADRLGKLWQRVGWEVAMSAVLVVFAAYTARHGEIWRDDLVLWETTAKTCPTSAYCHSNLGIALLKRNQVERGVKELIRAVELRDAPRYLVNLGDAYSLSLGDYRQALLAYRMALERSGAHGVSAEFYARIARANVLAGQLEEADQFIQAGLRENATEPSLWVVNSFLKWKQGDLRESLLSARRALAVTGQTSGAAGLMYHYWGDAGEVGKLLAALRAFQAAP